MRPIRNVSEIAGTRRRRSHRWNASTAGLSATARNIAISTHVMIRLESHRSHSDAATTTMIPTIVSTARGRTDVIAIRAGGGSAAPLGRSRVGGELTWPC